MPVRKIKFEKGKFYHIYNRGIGRESIFLSDKDAYRFLQAIYLSNNSRTFLGISELERNKSGYSIEEIEKMLKKNKIYVNRLVSVCALCLLPDHFHLILKERQKGGIARFMQKLGTSYGKYFANKYIRKGSLFQGRFKAIKIKNDSQVANALAYVNCVNPAEISEPHLRIKGVENFKKVWDETDAYQWSTHQEFMGRRKSVFLDKSAFLKVFPSLKSYCDFARKILLDKDHGFWKEIINFSFD